MKAADPGFTYIAYKSMLKAREAHVDYCEAESISAGKDFGGRRLFIVDHQGFTRVFLRCPKICCMALPVTVE